MSKLSNNASTEMCPKKTLLLHFLSEEENYEIVFFLVEIGQNIEMNNLRLKLPKKIRTTEPQLIFNGFYKIKRV